MADDSLNLLRGTLDVLVLKALREGPLHGYGIVQWVRSATDDMILVEEGSLYPALHRIERKGWVSAEWGRSDTGRRARFYTLTPSGEAGLESATREWALYARAMDAALGTGTGSP